MSAPDGMAEVMRLMRSGDLQGATAAIQRGMGSAVVTNASPDAPPEASPASGNFGEHRHAGLRYRLYVPNTAADTPRPLVLMLHGCTQDPEDFAAGTRMNALAEAHGVLVAYPAQSQAVNSSKCWNWFRRKDQQRDGGEPALLAGLVRHVVAQHGADPRRVYVAGLSAGGAMAVILGRTYPETFAAVGVHSGLPYASAHDVPSAFAAMRDAPEGRPASGGHRRIPTIVFHGDADATVHPRNGERVARTFAGTTHEEVAGATPGGRRHTRRIYRDGEQVVGEHWVVHGASHAWSGGSAAGSYTDPQGPDASREMLRFFLEQRAP